MRGLVVTAVILCAAISATLADAQPQPPRTSKIEQELIALDKRLADAESRRDANAVDQILAPDYTLVDQTGRVVSRDRALSVLKSGDHAHKLSMATSDYSVRVYDDVAVMTHAAVIKGAEDSVERLRTTHVWVRRNGRWQLAADQCTSVALPQIPTNKPFLDAACSEASFAPEVQQFYGSVASIQRKLDETSIALEKRRVYVLLVETHSSAELTVFDRSSVEEPVVKVSQWQGRTVGDLREQLSSAILENKGIACIGEQSKRILLAKYSPAEIARIPAPVSARAAFSHLLNPYIGSYVRATVFLLC